MRPQHALGLDSSDGARLVGVLLGLVVINFPRHSHMHGIPTTRLLVNEEKDTKVNIIAFGEFLDGRKKRNENIKKLMIIK